MDSEEAVALPKLPDPPEPEKESPIEPAPRLPKARLPVNFIPKVIPKESSRRPRKDRTLSAIKRDIKF